MHPIGATLNTVPLSEARGSDAAAPPRKVSLEQVVAVLEQVEKVVAKYPGRAREVLAGVMAPSS